MRIKTYQHRCKFCEKEFYAKRPEALYCSTGCKTKAFMNRRQLKNEQSRKKSCPSCGTIFQAKRKDAKYCSPAHRQRMHRFRKN